MTARKRSSLGQPDEKFLNGPCPTCGTPHAVINGFWLAAVRKRAGESQRQLAIRLGYAPAYLCDIESDHDRRTRAGSTPMTAEDREQWQPIETAPKEHPLNGGDSLLLAWVAPGVNEWVFVVGEWRDGWFSGEHKAYPRFWMPLPDPPGGVRRQEHSSSAARALEQAKDEQHDVGAHGRHGGRDTLGSS